MTAARIMGIESDHRTLARVLGPDVASGDGGPVSKFAPFTPTLPGELGAFHTLAG